MSEVSATRWEAAEWVAQRMGDEPFDRDGFDAWIAGDPERQAVFETMWQRIMGDRLRDALGTVKRRQAQRAVLAGSAAVATVLLGGYLAAPSLEMAVARPQQFAAATGTVETITLDDGTRFALAKGASVSVRFTRHGRAVELDRGVLFADVARDEDRPFTIDAGRGRVTVLGTHFEVATAPRNVRVTVESGRVRFGGRGWFDRSIDLTAGESGFMDGADLGRLADVDAGQIARWRNEWAEYENAPLSDIVRDLDVLSPRRIKIADPKLAGLKVSGRIRIGEPIRQLENLAIIHDFTIAEKNGEIEIKSSSSSTD